MADRVVSFDALHTLPIPEFRPPPVLRNPHLQTVLVPYLPAPSGERSERVRIPIDGGALTGHLHRALRGTPAAACILALHGIAGSAHEPFLLRIAQRARSRGLDTLRLHLRGAGESAQCGPPPLYHAGLTGDVRAALSYLLQRYRQVHAVGFSLGGQLVLRTLGEWGDDTPDGIASCTAISPPLDLAECAEYSDRPAALIYRLYILHTLKRRYLAGHTAMGLGFARDALTTVRTIREFDQAVVAPFFGFADVHDYYRRSCSGAVIDRIRVPTLIIHAKDDPLVTARPIERLRDRALPNIRVVMTDHGGHVGFLSARPAGDDATRYWAEERAMALASATTVDVRPV